LCSAAGDIAPLRAGPGGCQPYPTQVERNS
jgi:hypothetical protein